jgi:hypothetical protein
MFGATGVVELDFGLPGDGQVGSIAIDGDGRIVVCGAVFEKDPSSMVVARLWP